MTTYIGARRVDCPSVSWKPPVDRHDQESTALSIQPASETDCSCDSGRKPQTAFSGHIGNPTPGVHPDMGEIGQVMGRKRMTLLSRMKIIQRRIAVGMPWFHREEDSSFGQLPGWQFVPYLSLRRRMAETIPTRLARFKQPSPWLWDWFSCPVSGKSDSIRVAGTAVVEFLGYESWMSVLSAGGCLGSVCHQVYQFFGVCCRISGRSAIWWPWQNVLGTWRWTIWMGAILFAAGSSSQA